VARHDVVALRQGRGHECPGERSRRLYRSLTLGSIAIVAPTRGQVKTPGSRELLALTPRSNMIPRARLEAIRPIWSQALGPTFVQPGSCDLCFVWRHNANLAEAVAASSVTVKMRSPFDQWNSRLV
jgi:hypothetical protein